MVNVLSRFYGMIVKAESAKKGDIGDDDYVYEEEEDDDFEEEGEV